MNAVQLVNETLCTFVQQYTSSLVGSFHSGVVSCTVHTDLALLTKPETNLRYKGSSDSRGKETFTN